VNGKAVAVTSIGVLFVWSGIKGWSILGTVKDVITGVQPSGTNVNPLGVPLSSTTDSGSVTLGGSGNIADIAKGYIGHAYRFGGAPGRDGTKPWDCSSFLNWVVGVRAGGAIPGYAPGKYDGSVHGPTSGQWAVWPGLVHLKAADMQPGDILVYSGHVAIVVDSGHVVSALNPREGTKITSWNTGSGPVLVYGRLKLAIPRDKGAL